MTSSIDGLEHLRALAERVAAAARDPERLDEVRRAAQRALVGIDPEAIERDGAAYRAAQAEIVLAIVTALGERSLPRRTVDMLLKANRARALDAVARHPGLNQRQLAGALDLAPSNLNDYLGELREHGLIEQAAAREGRGVAFQITPWGRQAMSHLEAHHPDAARPASAAAAASRAALSRPRAVPSARPKNGLKR
jgi:DNA-binding MarR family transcriptional regulator